MADKPRMVAKRTKIATRRVRIDRASDWGRQASSTDLAARALHAALDRSNSTDAAKTDTGIWPYSLCQPPLLPSRQGSNDPRDDKTDHTGNGCRPLRKDGTPSSPPQGTRVPLPKSATPRIAHLREERTSLSRTNRGLYTHKFARPMGSQAHALETIKRPADLGDCNDVMSKSTSKRKIGRPLGGSTTSSTTAVHFGRVSPEKDTFPPPRTFVPCAVCLTTDCAFQEKNARPSSERLWTPTKTTIKARTTNGFLSPCDRRRPSCKAVARNFAESKAQVLRLKPKQARSNVNLRVQALYVRVSFIAERCKFRHLPRIRERHVHLRVPPNIRVRTQEARTFTQFARTSRKGLTDQVPLPTVSGNTTQSFPQAASSRDQRALKPVSSARTAHQWQNESSDLRE